MRMDLKKFWNGVSPGWRHITTDMTPSKKERILKRVEKNLISPLPKDQINHVLDWGCGGGLISRFLVNRGYSVCIADLVEDSIKECKKHVPEIEFSFIIPDQIKSLLYTGPKIDWIICNEVIQHFPSIIYLESVLDFWTISISPKYISIQTKRGENRELGDNYEKDFLNGLLLSKDFIDSEFNKRGYSCIFHNSDQTIAGIPLDYFIFEKK